MNTQWYKCPKCGSLDINAGRMENNDDSAWFYVECDDCGFGWNDVYQFSHAENPETYNILDADGNDIEEE